MYTNDALIRPRYSETDQMGVIYNGYYYMWFEVGRSEFFRSLGYTYKELEQEGIILPLTESSCKYYKPAMYDEEVFIRTSVDVKTASEMLTVLKYGLEDSDLLFNPVLPTVEVIEESVQDNLLKVTLSKSIHHAYAGNEVYAQSMMDSLVQSFASLPNVEEILIQTEIQNDGSLYGYTLGEAFTPARYLNME